MEIGLSALKSVLNLVYGTEYMTKNKILKNWRLISEMKCILNRQIRYKISDKFRGQDFFWRSNLLPPKLSKCTISHVYSSVDYN